MFQLNYYNKRGRERGSIIIFTVLMLGSILAISLSLAAIFLPKIRAISNAGSSSVGAFYAADSGLEWCLYNSRGNSALPEPVLSNGATYTITPGTCSGQPLDEQIVGTYQGVSRSLELSTP